MPRRLKVSLVELGEGARVLDYNGRTKRIDGPNLGLAALDDDEPVGYLIFRVVADDSSELAASPFVHLYSAWVDPAARRRGVFAQMGAYLVERYPGYRMHGYPADDYGAVRRFLKRSVKALAAAGGS